MSAVRRIKPGSAAGYRPRFTIIERTQRRAFSPWKTVLWCLVGVSIAFSLLGAQFAMQIAMQHIVLAPLPASASNPPIYPGAQNVTVKDLSGGGKEVSFPTIDSNDQVLGFYNQALTKDGWERLFCDDAPCAGRFMYNRRSIGGYDVDSRGFYVSFGSSTEVTVTVSDISLPSGF